MMPAPRKMPLLIIAGLVSALLAAPGCGRQPESQSTPVAARETTAGQSTTPGNAKPSTATSLASDARVGAGPVAGAESYRSRVDSSKIGRPMSLREAYPDYQPGTDDPEFESTITGRRKVAQHDRPLSEGGATSLKSLLEQVAIAVDAADGKAVQRLSVSRSDFETILWPEMPQSRPAANVPAGEAWDFLYNRNMASYNRAMGDLNATGIRLKSFRIGKTIEYTNYRLLDDMTVEVEQADHQPVTLDLVRTVVERSGRFKIYSTRD